MTRAVQHWLISYRYRASFKYIGRINSNAPADAVDVIDTSPAEFIRQARQAVLDLEDAEPKSPPERADRIECIYSAVPISEDEYRQLAEIL